MDGAIPPQTHARGIRNARGGSRATRKRENATNPAPKIPTARISTTNRARSEFASAANAKRFMKTEACVWAQTRARFINVRGRPAWRRGVFPAALHAKTARHARRTISVMPVRVSEALTRPAMIRIGAPSTPATKQRDVTIVSRKSGPVANV